jgi:hypothetical protein
MAVTLGVGQILAVRRLGYALTDETLSTRQRRVARVGLPFGETYALCLLAVRHLGKSARVEEESDYAAGLILALTGVTFGGRTSGERLRFELRPVEGGIEVAVESRPHWPLTLVDDGTSLRHVHRIVAFLRASGAPEEEAAAAAHHRGKPCPPI